MQSVESLFKDFMTNHYKSYYGTRDNCGIAAIDLMLFLQDMGFKAERIQGYFLCDIPVHNKKDFTKEMKNEFMMSGLDFNSKEDRLNWIKESKYFEEWLKCPHYWVVVEGEILDPSGVAQFIDSGLAKDLNTHRYLKI